MDLTKTNFLTPPGMEKTVKALKQSPVTNPWAVAWSIYDKEKGKEINHSADCSSPEAKASNDISADFLGKLRKLLASGMNSYDAVINARKE